MKFYYLVAAYNEETSLRDTVLELASISRQFPGSEVLLLDNNSQDGTWSVMQTLSQENAGWVTCYHETKKGLGVAFKRGLRELQKRPLGADSWIVFCAADLPFGKSDLESLLAQQESVRNESVLFVGSKRHPRSQAKRNWRRMLGSFVFEFSRWLLLGIKTKDTQGSLFLRGDHCTLVEKLVSDDYFFSVELVYYAEKLGPVHEMPVVLKPDRRVSKVSVLRDGWKSLKQLWRFRRSL